MITIARITLREILLRLVEPFRTAAGAVADRRVLLLTLADADGVEAWSECVAEAFPSYSPETIDTCWLAMTQWLVPRVLGRSFSAPDEVHTALESDVRGHHMAKAAVEMGAWALDAERQGIPLARLLARATPPREHVETGIALGLQASPDALVERSREALSSGYRRIKIKIEPGRDVAYIRAVREEFGPDINLTADANCSYAHDDRSVQAMQELDAFGLKMIEQPLAADDLLRHAELQRYITTPICLDESITGLSSAEAMLALGSGRFVNLKPGRVGGFSEALAIHDLCERAGVPVWCGGMLESGIGRAYNIALASLPNFTEPGDLSPSARYWERDVVSPPWTMDSAARVRVPLDRPGLGVTVDAGRVDDLTVRLAMLGEH